MSEAYERIVAHYEACLERHGDTPQGVDWPNAEDAETRHRVMLDVVRPSPEPVTLLDLGCGAGHLYEHIVAAGIEDVTYTGADLSTKFIELCTSKHPDVPFHQVDLLRDPEALPEFDYVVLCGVFTEKTDLSYEEMFDFYGRMLRAAWSRAREGIAFNVMSKHVDWERDDLFHVPFDETAALLRDGLTRNFVFRNDYGLYEYTTYAYRSV